MRIAQEKIERQVLADYASFSDAAVRKHPQSKCDLRTEYQRDRDRILHSKAFRRLKHKTQVFLSPEGDHYRTRLTHTLEVAQIARTIARALRLNEDLTEAISLGHDLGHTPFGHCGENVLAKVHPSGFRHNEHSIRVAEFLEVRSDGARGLNLTTDTLDGILNHSTGSGGWPRTHEGAIVRYSDKIAYIHHDIDDSFRAKVLVETDIPSSVRSVLGQNNNDRLNTLIHSLILHYFDHPKVGFSTEVRAAFDELMGFMYKSVYFNKVAKKEETKAQHIVNALYGYYSEHPNQMPIDRYQDYVNGERIEAVKDFIAGMSDRYAVSAYQALYVPSSWL